MEEESMPLWAQRMEVRITTLFTETNKRLSKLEESVGNLQFKVETLDNKVRLAYCRPGRAETLLGDADACSLLFFNRNVCSVTKLNVSEIFADYEVNKRGRDTAESNGGNCLQAAKSALDFFGTFPLMKATLVNGLIYSKEPLTLVCQPGAIISKRGMIEAGMKSYKLKRNGELYSCVWEETNEDTKDLVGQEVPLHYAVKVLTLEGFHCIVDWSIAQFKDVPENTRFFV